MTEVSGDRYDEVAEKAHGHGFNQILGLELDAVGENWARVTVPHDERFVNPETESVMHGGVVTTTLDAAQAYAMIARLHDDPRSAGPTMTLNVNFVSTADEPLVVTGRVLRVGRRNAILEGRAEGADTGDLVATGQGVWRVFSGDS
jgi:uncharacterized protein (TIGR00369 family)